jgi:hypothetical protein
MQVAHLHIGFVENLAEGGNLFRIEFEPSSHIVDVFAPKLVGIALSRNGLREDRLGGVKMIAKNAKGSAA